MPKKGHRKRLKFRPGDVCSESGNDRYHLLQRVRPPSGAPEKPITATFDKCNITDAVEVVLMVPFPPSVTVADYANADPAVVKSGRMKKAVANAVEKEGECASWS